jgi:glycosyltransferase involved in cell wall biosynthesis
VGVGSPDMSGPAVSVIVPTRNRASSLAKLLVSLDAQTHTDFEVVVVDDGSTDSTPDVAQRSPRVRYVRGNASGAVDARILGVKMATGATLAFTDDDCIVDPGWLAAGVAAIESGADVAQGRTLPQREPLPLERTVEHDAEDRLYATCNVFYRRVAFERVGGFDTFAGERLGFRSTRRARAMGFGEDSLLGWMVARAGPSVAVREAVVRHEVLRPSLRELFYREWIVGGFPRLLREVPELRWTLIRRRIVLGYTGPRLWVYPALLVLVPPLRLLGVAGMIVWVGARTRALVKRPGSLGQRLRALPIEMALDLTRAAALMLGSALARKLVI